MLLEIETFQHQLASLNALYHTEKERNKLEMNKLKEENAELRKQILHEEQCYRQFQCHLNAFVHKAIAKSMQLKINNVPSWDYIRSIGHINDAIFSNTDSTTCFLNLQYQCLLNFAPINNLLNALKYQNLTIFKEYCKSLPVTTFDIIMQSLARSKELDNCEQYIEDIMQSKVNFRQNYQIETICTVSLHIACRIKNINYIKYFIYNYHHHIINIDNIINRYLWTDLSLACTIFASIPDKIRIKYICQYSYIKSAIKLNNKEFLELTLENFPLTVYYQEIFLMDAIDYNAIDIVKYFVEVKKVVIKSSHLQKSVGYIRDFLCGSCK